jgi:hypothetical protein
MKIVQEIAICGFDQTYSTVLTETFQHLFFQPSKYTGITAIYFEIWQTASNTDGESFVELYDKTHSVSLASWQVSSQTLQHHKTVDIKNSLTESCELIIRSKRVGGTYGSSQFQNGCLIIEQDTVDDVKMTAAYYVTNLGSDVYTQNWWIYSESTRNLPRISANDGIVKVNLEVYTKCAAGQTAYIKLFDYDADVDVPNSEMNTTSTSWVKLTSPELTLIEGHRYYVMIKGGVNGKNYWFSTAYLIVTVEGFSKCAALILSKITQEIDSDNPKKILPEEEFPLDKLQANKITYQYDIKHYTDETSPSGLDFSLRNIDTNENVDDSLYHIPYGDTVSTFETVTFKPSECTNFIVTYWENTEYSMEWYGASIFALLEGEYSEPVSLPADKNQPSGYHCFMSQFFKNMLAGLIPLKTPDGVNKCW